MHSLQIVIHRVLGTSPAEFMPTRGHYEHVFSSVLCHTDWTFESLRCKTLRNCNADLHLQD